MKKSQLRNIIKESIKELINEQYNPANNGTTNAGSGCFVLADYPTNNTYNQSHCVIQCQGNQFPAACCDNTNNQPFNAPNGFPWTLIGVEGQTVPCAPNCFYSSPSSTQLQIPSGDLEDIIVNYSTLDIIDTSSPYPAPLGTSNGAPYWYGVWVGSPTQTCENFMSSPPPPPIPLVAGCTVVQSLNYDPNADGCEVNGVVDPNDVTCCTQTQPGGSTTPTNVGQQSADNLTLQVADPITPTPNPSDPQMKRMKDLAFRGKNKKYENN